MDSPITPAQTKTSPAASLALLKALWDNDRRDYLAIFVPFVAESLRISGAPVVSLPELQADLLNRFALRVPQHALKVVIAKAQRKGYVRVRNKAFMPVPDALVGLQFQTAQDRILTSFEDLVRALRQYAGETLGIEWKSADAEQALSQYITSAVVTLGGGNTALVAVPEGPSSATRYHVARFVDHLRESHSPLLRQVESIQQGYMLGTALYLPDQGQINRKFHHTSIFFDTSFLIRALGYGGEARQAPCSELLHLLYATGARLCCFRHTADEIRGALEACAGHLRRGQSRALYGPGLETVQYFIDKGYSSADVELFVTRLERDLANLELRIVDTPGYDQHKHVIGEAQLREHLSERIQYSNQDALDRDVQSLSAIVRARRGRAPNLIEDSGAVFVTTNNRLVHAARSFFDAEHTSYGAPVCINDFTLTNLVWLKTPTTAPDLPLKRLVADAHAALQPNDELWRAFLQHVRRQRDQGSITEDDYYDLRYNLTAKSSLMELSNGEPDTVTEGTVLDILRIVRENREAAARAHVQAELDESRAGAERIAEELRTAQGREADQSRRLEARARHVSKWIARVVAGVFLIVILIGSWVLSPWASVGSLVFPWSYGLTFIGVAILLYSAWSLYSGSAVLLWMRRLETVLEPLVLTALRRLAALDA